MSSLYNLEPQPTGKVLLETTSGDILLELFAKQTPRTSRNFLQLCLDGYYNGTIFHRLVPGFVIQGGDPTGTGDGGDASYNGGVFEDEFHSRLKYNRRGLLGMANTGRKDDNGSQFFMTLGATPELQGKNTLFGRVEGDTIYNVMKMGEADLAEGEGNERPLYPTKITGTSILVNPFDDMTKKSIESQSGTREVQGDVKKSKKRKAGKAILSFGGDEEQEEPFVKPVIEQKKLNATLVSQTRQNSSQQPKPLKEAQSDTNQRIERAIRRKRPRSRSVSPYQETKPHTQMPSPNDESPSRSPSVSPQPEQVTKMSSLLEKTNAQIAEMKKSMKRNVPAPALQVHKKSALEEKIPETSIRGRKRRLGGGAEPTNDTDTLNILNAFRDKLGKMAPPSATTRAQVPDVEMINGDAARPVHNGEGGDEEESAVCDLHFIASCQSCKSWDQHEDDNDDANNGGGGDDWMSHTLTFEKDRLGKDLSWKKKNEDDLVVIDTRKKVISVKEEQRAKKAAKMSGTTGRAWDHGRGKGTNSQLVK